MGTDLVFSLWACCEPPQLSITLTSRPFTECQPRLSALSRRAEASAIFQWQQHILWFWWFKRPFVSAASLDLLFPRCQYIYLEEPHGLLWAEALGQLLSDSMPTYVLRRHLSVLIRVTVQMEELRSQKQLSALDGLQAALSISCCQFYGCDLVFLSPPPFSKKIQQQHICGCRRFEGRKALAASTASPQPWVKQKKVVQLECFKRSQFSCKHETSCEAVSLIEAYSDFDLSSSTLGHSSM